MNKPQVLIGSHNLSKVEYYKKILGSTGARIISLSEIPDPPIVEEDLFDIIGNSTKKALVYARSTGHITLSDDTGIFIPALNNEPGVAVRRWAGKLPASTTDDEWLAFLRQRIMATGLKNPQCQKRQVVTIAKPDGEYRIFEHTLAGVIILRDLAGMSFRGGPFSYVFFLPQYGKFESDLSEDEFYDHHETLRLSVITYVSSLFLSKKLD